MPTSRRTITILAITGVIAVVAAVAAVVLLRGQSPEPPARGTKIVASDLSKATDAATRAADGSPEQAAARYLSEQPTAVWLTPEGDPVDVVGERIAGLAAEARDQSARVAVVVYGLPERDCGGHSAGGLEGDAYLEWTRAIGDALREAADTSPIVILEPDSLALAPECGNVDERVEQLSAAVEALAAESTWIYVDGGHSNWLAPAEMADLIDRVDRASRGDGGRGIRGFVTNVSNFEATDDEVDYAHDVASRLDDLHAIIDTGRNGAGSNGEWCNPPGRLVGEPGGTIGDDVVDTNLWVKPPGESDGDCNGGPAAGQWWPEAAVELTRDVVTD
ncbi:endoglucanase [Microbacterium trichothecenolyticum]|uniref:glycoside hydrolase family 6 protein n=1 Tax=Microbacterium trichothecenolyticum TaxID=69370 RepID=UPI002867187A|nr:glycoside hydrolase family 6 protein [Microbacterium trichothecenolyticum]MDR7112876.1 endoglucanase [Microbacterium trichothecenolyticum]